MSEEISYKQVRQEVEQFLSYNKGHSFTSDHIDKQFNYGSREAKRYRWQVLDEFVGKGVLELAGTGKYRYPDNELETIDWQQSDVEDVIQVKWPLGFERYIKTYHQSINMIAGCPGAGKTSFLYEFVLRNMNNPMGVVLFTNDMSPEEIKERFLNSGIEIPNPPPWQTFSRQDNFGDVIQPDMINVIDYLDLNSEFYLIGAEIEKIYRKLRRGIAVVAIQKRPGQDIGVGGLPSWKRAKLYFALDTLKDQDGLYHKIKVVKARGRVNPLVNPVGLEFQCKLVGGIKFVPRSKPQVDLPK